MATVVTPQQILALWDDPNPHTVIDRGDHATPVTKDDLGALASGLDTDDEGRPLDDQWEVLADQLNSEIPTEPSSSAGHSLIQEITDARLERDRLKRAADEEFNRRIRTFMLMPKAERPASVTAVAAAADMSRERLYQIRDGRR